MIDDRNDYGFPLDSEGTRYQTNAAQNNYLAAMQNTANNCLGMLNSYYGARMIGFRTETKLERAQAYAADVRSRKFPPVQRITPKEE